MSAKITLLTFLFFLIFASCEEEKPPISQDKMAIILSELHLAEAYAQITPIDMGGVMKKNIDSMLVLYSHIYKKNDIDSLSFKNALNWYHNHPSEFDKVYEHVLKKLSLAKETGIDSSSVQTDTAKVEMRDTL